MIIQCGQVWTSPDTGNRWKVIGLQLGSDEGDGRVNVQRLPRIGQRRLPKWEGDGIYLFHASQFQTMQLETAATDRSPTAFPDFSFDGFGINGKDANRSRLATLTAAGQEAGVGPLFAAADKLLAACKALLDWAEVMGGWEAPGWDQARDAINAADPPPSPVS